MQKLLAKILKRKYAYRRLFLGEDGLNGDGQIVLADLAKFCKAYSSTAVVSPVSRQVDPVASALAEGRREVWLRIMAHLHIDEKVAFNLNQNEDSNE
jgi:hypothetical protein